MTLYVTTDGSGRPTGFYDSNLNGTPPAGAQVVTAAQRAQLVAAPTTTTFIAGTIGTIAPPAAPTPTPAQLAEVALTAGLAVTSTAHSAVSGTYAVDGASIGLMGTLAQLIAQNSGAFPGSATTWQWPDASGTLHTIPSAAEFLALYAALATYRLALMQVVWGVTTTLPAATATIA